MNPSPSNMAGPEAVLLSPIDVERLLQDESPDSRTSVLEKIAASYNGDQFQGRAKEIAEQVFRLLMKDVAVRVRETLAERLKDNMNTPRDVVLHMAGDVESVAVPVLEHSKVLSDADLVSIVERSQDVGKYLAISRRETVSPRVSDALVETRYAQVMTSLLENKGASLSERAFLKIADDFRDNLEVMEALSCKPKLPITVVERLITQVSGAVAAQLKKDYNLDDKELSKGTNMAREDFMLRLLENDLSQEEVEALVAQMAQEDRLNPSIVMTALCRGQLLFFTVAVAQFAKISVENARKLIADRGPIGFARLYEKSGLPETMRDAVGLLLRAVQEMQADPSVPGSLLYANRLAERVILLAGKQQIEYLPYFIALIRQNHHRG